MTTDSPVADRIRQAKEITLFFDGGCWPNPGGVSTFGWLLKAWDKRILTGCGKALKGGRFSTNNVAEYYGLRAGLQALTNCGFKGDLQIKGDSQLVVLQIMGRWRAKKKYLAALRDECRSLLNQLGHFRIEWIPREENSEADALTRQALRSAKVRRRLTTIKKTPNWLSEAERHMASINQYAIKA